jgi:FkbM family methyltransferase
MDPVEGSVTKAFYDVGWSGINIEPDSRFYDRLVAQRTRDLNLNVALGAADETRPFYSFEDQGISTFSEDFRDYFAARGRSWTEMDLRVQTLAEICNQYIKGPIDFLKIDAEGWEGPILEGGNWQTFRPLVLVIEATRPFSHIPAWENWEPFVTNKCGYLFAYFDGLNRFYIRQENSELREQFLYPPNVLDDFKPYALVKAEQDLSGAHVENERLTEQLNRVSGLLDAERRRAEQLTCEKNYLSARVDFLDEERTRERSRVEQLIHEKANEQFRAKQLVQEREVERHRAEELGQKLEAEHCRAEELGQELDAEHRRAEQLVQEREVERLHTEQIEQDRNRERLWVGRLSQQCADQRKQIVDLTQQSASVRVQLADLQKRYDELDKCAAEYRCDLVSSLAALRMDPIPVLAADDFVVKLRAYPSMARVREQISVDVCIENKSSYHLISRPPHPVHICYHWHDETHTNCVIFDGLRTSLQPVLIANSQREYAVTVESPPIAGRYTLTVTLVQEGVRWFDVFPTCFDRIAIEVR